MIIAHFPPRVGYKIEKIELQSDQEFDLSVVVNLKKRKDDCHVHVHVHENTLYYFGQLLCCVSQRNCAAEH